MKVNRREGVGGGWKKGEGLKSTNRQLQESHGAVQCSGGDAADQVAATVHRASGL